MTELKLSPLDHDLIQSMGARIAVSNAGTENGRVDNQHRLRIVEAVVKVVTEALEGLELPSRADIEDELRDTAGFDAAHAAQEEHHGR